MILINGNQNREIMPVSISYSDDDLEMNPNATKTLSDGVDVCRCFVIASCHCEKTAFCRHFLIANANWQWAYFETCFRHCEIANVFCLVVEVFSTISSSSLSQIQLSNQANMMYFIF